MSKPGARKRTLAAERSRENQMGRLQISTRSRSTEMTIQTREKLHQLALGLIRSVFPPPKGIRLVGVTLSNFQAQPAAKQRSFLFPEARSPTTDAPPALLAPFVIRTAPDLMTCQADASPRKGEVAACVRLKNLVMIWPRPPTPHRPMTRNARAVRPTSKPEVARAYSAVG